jgi:hypothetical protein
MDEMKDISDALAGPSTMSSTEEMELEEELEALMKTPILTTPAKSAKTANTTSFLPSAPTRLPPTPIASAPSVIDEVDHTDQIRDLEKRLAML